MSLTLSRRTVRKVSSPARHARRDVLRVWVVMALRKRAQCALQDSLQMREPRPVMLAVSDSSAAVESLTAQLVFQASLGARFGRRFVSPVLWDATQMTAARPLATDAPQARSLLTRAVLGVPNVFLEALRATTP